MPLFVARLSTKGPAADHPGQERKGYWVLKDVVGPSHDLGSEGQEQPQPAKQVLSGSGMACCHFLVWACTHGSQNLTTGVLLKCSHFIFDTLLTAPRAP